MTIEPNLKIDNKKSKIYVNACHEPDKKWVILKAGFHFRKCKDCRKIFAQYPDLQNFIERKITPYEHSVSDFTGDDTIFSIGKDITCYAIDNSKIEKNNLDELSFAAYFLHGIPTKPQKVFETVDGTLLKNILELTEEDLIEIEKNTSRNIDATNAVLNMLRTNIDEVIRMLTYGYHLNKGLGSKNEDLFTTPRQIDKGGMPRFGFECIEETSYDLIIPGGFDYTISDKIKKNVFHKDTSGNVRNDYIIGGLQMTNVRSGQSSEKSSRPKFDTLIVMQYNPYLVCGVIPYFKIAKHFKRADGGMTLRRVPINDFEWVITPTSYYKAAEIPEEQHREIRAFIDLVNGGLMNNLLSKKILVPPYSIPLEEQF